MRWPVLAAGGRVADARLAPWKKRAKYRNVKTEVDGLKFDSKKEAKRWVELKQLLDAGRISNLMRQVMFQLVPQVVLDGRKQQPVKYVADFQYQLGNQIVVEDVKGFKTPEYRMKRKMMKAFLNIEVQEI
jgi:Fe2+ transport system protein B